MGVRGWWEWLTNSDRPPGSCTPNRFKVPGGERWRRLAVLQSDAEGYRRMVRRVAQTSTGQESPADEPLALTRSKAGM